MLRFYYTVSSAYNAAQPKKSDSLGGYKSSTPVVNDMFSNVFDEISLNLAANPLNQYIALILKNEGAETLSNINLWFSSVTKNTYGELSVGAISMGTDEEGNLVTPNTRSVYDKPYWIEFHPATEDNKVVLGDMAPDMEICIWLCRSLNATLINQDYDNVAEKDPNTRNRYKKVEKETEDVINLNLFWE